MIVPGNLFSKFFNFGPGFLAGEAKPPQTPPKRSFVTFDQGSQTGPPRSTDLFPGAADDTGAADDRPKTAGIPGERVLLDYHL